MPFGLRARLKKRGQPSGPAGWLRSEVFRDDRVSHDTYGAALRREGLFPIRDIGEWCVALTQATNLQTLLRYEDRNSMAHGVEARVPFLDHRLVELSIGLGERYKIHGSETKRILRLAMKGILPESIRQRRDKIGRTYTSRINPLTRFALDESGVLTFDNPAVAAKYSDPPKKGYQATWHRFDNGSGSSQPIGSATPSATTRVQGPSDLPRGDGTFLKVSVSAIEPPHEPWSKPVDVYFRRTGGAWKLVGVERLPDAQK